MVLLRRWNLATDVGGLKAMKLCMGTCQSVSYVVSEKYR